jgi:predicted anti-sigma-YlaC factor YlaD
MSTTCRDLRPLLGAYVLGALEPEEAAEVREHVATCPACAAEHTRLAPLPGLLTLAEGAQRATEEPPTPAMEERLLDAVARERPRPKARRGWRRRGAALLASGFAAAAIAVGVVAVTTGGADHGYLALHATSVTGAKAHAELQQAAGGTVMHLWVSGMPADTKAVYEVRCDSKDWSASAGTFRVDANGRAAVVLTTAARRGQYDRIRILRKSPAGDHLVFAAALS